MQSYQVQIDRENKILIPDKAIKQMGLKADQEFTIYIDNREQHDEQLFKIALREGIIPA